MWRSKEALRKWIGQVGLGEDLCVGESEQDALQSMRVLLEASRTLAHDLAYHRRARLVARIGQALDEVDRQIEDLRRYQF